MKDLKKSMDSLISNSTSAIIVNPDTLKRLKEKGFPFKAMPQHSIEESVDILFDKRKKSAIQLAKKLPDFPFINAPAIQSIYNEIRECIIFGLNGAAITLSGILVEFTLKYIIVVKETSGFKYDAKLWDEIEGIALADTIERAKNIELITGEEKSRLIRFKNEIRNPYNHYNIKKITKDVEWKNVNILNIETKKIKERNIKAKDDPVVQAQAKPYVDKKRVFDVFEFADQIVKELFSRI